MSCPIMKHRYEPIADELTDHGTILYPNHTVFTHLGCVLLRTFIGIKLISPEPKSDACLRNIIIIMIISMFIFGMKYFSHVILRDTIYWKCYLRMLVAYSSALCLIFMGQQNFAGLIIITDALMGMNSRHTASVLSCGI